MDGEPDFDAITAWAMSLLTMRVNTPSGEWLPADFERVYRQGWGELEAAFGAGTASEMAILDLANIAMHLVDYLVVVTASPRRAGSSRSGVTTSRRIPTVTPPATSGPGEARARDT